MESKPRAGSDYDGVSRQSQLLLDERSDWGDFDSEPGAEGKNADADTIARGQLKVEGQGFEAKQNGGDPSKLRLNMVRVTGAPFTPPHVSASACCVRCGEVGGWAAVRPR